MRYLFLLLTTIFLASCSNSPLDRAISEEITLEEIVALNEQDDRFGDIYNKIRKGHESVINSENVDAEIKLASKSVTYRQVIDFVETMNSMKDSILDIATAKEDNDIDNAKLNADYFSLVGDTYIEYADLIEKKLEEREVENRDWYRGYSNPLSQKRSEFDRIVIARLYNAETEMSDYHKFFGSSISFEVNGSWNSFDNLFKKEGVVESFKSNVIMTIKNLDISKDDNRPVWVVVGHSFWAREGQNGSWFNNPYRYFIADSDNKTIEGFERKQDSEEIIGGNGFIKLNIK